MPSLISGAGQRREFRRDENLGRAYKLASGGDS